jgi:respiratory-subunit NADH dehydrogenase subunit
VTVRGSAGWLTAVAARAEAPVFLARGIGAADADAQLRASPRLRVVDSPRAATVLVVAGYVPNELAEPLARVHDQMAHPRVTVWWTGAGDSAAPAGWSHATIVGPRGDIEAAVVAAYRDVITGGRRSEPPLLPDVDPAPWRGVGPYGHGGTGMTGGIPYGRPMAGRADDRRDRLTLDVVPVRIGPFFPHLPEGLVLEVTFAGDVVHDLTVKAPPAVGGGGLGAPLPADAVAADRAAPVAAIEQARARQHLRWLARLLHLYGLDALARLVAVEAVSGRHDRRDLIALGRRLERSWALGRTTRGVGVINGDDAALWSGPVARAAGLACDARAYSTVYATLGFQPIVHTNGDNRDRWRQRLAETVQAIELAGRAGTAVIEPGETIEPAAPPPPARFGEQLAALLIGAEWGDAVATIASLDPDVNAAGYVSTGAAL